MGTSPDQSQYGGWAADSVVFDRSFGARIKTLLRTDPIHQVADVPGQRSWAGAGFDLHTLCLAAIDAVVSRQRLPDEATYDLVHDLLRELARAAVTGAGEEVYGEVAGYVLAGLLNAANRSTPFGYELVDYSREGRRRRVEFALLYEREQRATGTVVLNATVDAINALVGGLDCDVEDEQAALELILGRQLAQGKFEQAELSASKGIQLSLKYTEEMMAALESTRRDVRSIDWKEAMPERIGRAIAHVGERLSAEARLLEHVREGRFGEGAQRGRRPTARTIGRLIDLLEECRTRHTELHRQLLGARTTFLDEQVRQRFRPPASLQTPDLDTDVLHPVLRLSLRDARTVCDVFAAGALGPHAPRMPRISRLVDTLLAPRTTNEAARAEADEPGELAEPAPAIDAEQVEAAVAIIADVGLPSRLSVLLGAAGDGGAARLIVYATLWAYAPSSDETDQDPDEVATRILGPNPVITSDGTQLAMPKWCGDDLVLAADEQQSATFWETATEGA